jgi:2-dehydropantoate 2-reductase
MLKPVDSFLKFEATRSLVHQIMEEVIIAANTEPLLKIIPLSMAEKMVASSNKLGHYRPSMLIDRLKGRPMELVAFFGVPLQVAAKNGIQMPHVAQIFALLQLTEKD